MNELKEAAKTEPNAEDDRSADRSVSRHVDRALERRLREAQNKTGIAWIDRATQHDKQAQQTNGRPYRALAPLGFVALAVVLLSLFLLYGGVLQSPGE